jgi:hypothetical protein
MRADWPLQVNITEDQTTPEQLRDAFRVLANDEVNKSLFFYNLLSHRDAAFCHRAGSSIGAGPSAFDRLFERGDSIKRKRGRGAGVRLRDLARSGFCIDF